MVVLVEALKNSSHDAKHDKANYFRLVEIFRERRVKHFQYVCACALFGKIYFMQYGRCPYDNMYESEHFCGSDPFPCI